MKDSDVLKCLIVGPYQVDIEKCKNSQYNTAVIKEEMRKMALDIIEQETVVGKHTPEFLDFFVRLSGLKNKDIAAYLAINQNRWCDYKKGKRKLTKIGYSSVRHFFHHVFTNNYKVTGLVYINNHKTFLESTK